MVSSVLSLFISLSTSSCTSPITFSAYLTASLLLFTSLSHCLLTVSVSTTYCLSLSTYGIPHYNCLTKPITFTISPSASLITVAVLIDCLCLPQCIPPHCLLECLLIVSLSPDCLTDYFNCLPHRLPHLLTTISVYLTGYPKKPLKP